MKNYLESQEYTEIGANPAVHTRVGLSFEPCAFQGTMNTFLLWKTIPKVTKHRVFPAALPEMASDLRRALAPARAGHLSSVKVSLRRRGNLFRLIVRTCMYLHAGGASRSYGPCFLPSALPLSQHAA